MQTQTTNPSGLSDDSQRGPISKTKNMPGVLPNDINDFGANKQLDISKDPVIQEMVNRFVDLNDTFLADLVITDENAADASDNLRALKVHIQEINKRRLAMTRPIDEAKKEIIRQARNVLKPLEEAKKVLEQKLLGYQLEKKRQEEEHQRYLIEQEKERLEAEKKELEEQAELNQSEYALDEAIVVEEQIKAVEDLEIKSTGQVKSDYSTSSLSYKWVFSLIDFAQVPDEYKTLNEVKIRRVIAGKYGTHEIPGLKITKEPVLSTRGR